jgi:hypothetical protein
MFGKKKQFSSASPCSAEVLKCSDASLHFLLMVAYLLNLLSQHKIIAALHNSYLHSIERSSFDFAPMEWFNVLKHHMGHPQCKILICITAGQFCSISKSLLGSKLSKVTTIVESFFNIPISHLLWSFDVPHY